ncbi:putative membrane protein [Nicotiana attenuata]|uniref:Membrane protein n=1 Tax=Nicotiana attenuata TaxID=49451 RepID=A0A1J6II42_NICAT|nr:putative membrane protein [Nicotiana attenuata]
MNQNNLSHSNVAQNSHCFKLALPSLALYIVLALFLFGLAVSLFILVVVHNPLFFLVFLFLFALIAAFLIWNSLSFRHNRTILHYLRSFPDSDLSTASHGQLVKITGLVSCGNVSLESSYEKVGRCVYTSTLLFECGELGLKPVDVKESCFRWRLAYSEV